MVAVPGPPGPPFHVGTPGALGKPPLSTQAESRTLPHSGRPRQRAAGTRAHTVRSADAREGKGSSRSSAAGLGSLARGRRRAPGVGPMGVHGGTGRWPAQSQAPRRRWLCGRKGAPSPHTAEETFSGAVQPRALLAARGEPFRKKEQIPNHKNFTAAKS